MWSAGVILYVLASGSLPFDESSLPELYDNIVHARYTVPRFFSNGLAGILRKILVPDPRRRARIVDIKRDEWFKNDYQMVAPHADANLQALRYEDVDDMLRPNDVEMEIKRGEKGDKESGHQPYMLSLNAFELINLSAFDLGNLFEQHADIVHRHTRFVTTEAPKRVVRRIAEAAQHYGLKASAGTFKVKLDGQMEESGYLTAIAELFEILPGLCFAEFRRARGDPREFHQLFRRIQSDLSDLVTKRDEETVSSAERPVDGTGPEDHRASPSSGTAHMRQSAGSVDVCDSSSDPDGERVRCGIGNHSRNVETDVRPVVDEKLAMSVAESAVT